MVRCLITFFEVQPVSEELSPRSYAAIRILAWDFVPTGLHVDYRIAMPRLVAFYLPRVLIPDRRKIEETVKKAVQ